MASGDIHIGKYWKNKKHGKGMIKFVSGNLFTGKWIED